MSRFRRSVLLSLVVLGLAVYPASAQTLPGTTVEERAINGAKEYLKKHNLANPTQTMLMISLFKNSMPAYAKQWEKLTGVKMQFIEYDYPDIPAKIMAEAVAKTGQYDIFKSIPLRHSRCRWSQRADGIGCLGRAR